ncbi:hypothetical protein LG943_01165 [Streptomonospora sp. S1-112]|uniref:Uncharacterized protein n=1 Tax=Streptomonospora mangrovi TaxID=2883123 RepID=A0A9X3NG68_9ACTN|nr:hypothetical protein [Streptomonospora mangrovi]MDA0562952.1 hypothetical protein [Streptomonospora mangrovi]
MIIWRGWGILVLLITGLCCVPGGLVTEAVLGADLALFGVSGGLVVAGVAVFFIGQRLNAPRQGFHPQTGQPVLYRNQHTFFFVPMQYFAFVLLAVSVVLLISTLLGLVV